uniref:DUF1618 domain-containing protein n=1 Tax=Oryza nivara TaxID=4536 RepID=A0A0E0ID18_ORYNI
MAFSIAGARAGWNNDYAMATVFTRTSNDRDVRVSLRLAAPLASSCVQFYIDDAGAYSMVWRHQPSLTATSSSTRSSAPNEHPTATSLWTTSSSTSPTPTSHGYGLCRLSPTGKKYAPCVFKKTRLQHHDVDTLKLPLFEWEVDGTLQHEEELWSLPSYQGSPLPRITPTFPVFSMHEADVLHFILDRPGYDDKCWVITVDIKNKSSLGSSNEFRDYLMISTDLSKYSLLAIWTGYQQLEPTEWEETRLVQYWWESLANTRGIPKKGLQSLVLLVVWEIWKKRNRRIFDHKEAATGFSNQ